MRAESILEQTVPVPLSQDINNKMLQKHTGSKHSLCTGVFRRKCSVNFKELNKCKLLLLFIKDMASELGFQGYRHDFNLTQLSNIY